jgi:hypothetical protein
VLEKRTAASSVRVKRRAASVRVKRRATPMEKMRMSRMEGGDRADGRTR